MAWSIYIVIPQWVFRLACHQYLGDLQVALPAFRRGILLLSPYSVWFFVVKVLSLPSPQLRGNQIF